MRGICKGVGGGAKSDSAVVIVAVHVGGAPVFWLNPVPEPHVTALVKAVEPFVNWTVPVGAAPLLVGPITVAVSVTILPAIMDVELALTAIWVVAGVMVNDSVLLVLFELKLASPEYAAVIGWLPPFSWIGWSSAKPELLSLAMFVGVVVLGTTKLLSGCPPSSSVIDPVGHPGG